MSDILQAHGAPLHSWLAYWGLMARVHRFESHGLEHLDGERACLITGYHGRPVAYDLCFLSVELHKRLGYLPHAIFHGSFEAPGLRWYLEGLGSVTNDDVKLAQVVGRGEHIIALPGGTREGHRSWRRPHQVDWGERLGYLRLAIKHRMPIVPVAGAGVDRAYLGLFEGYKWRKRLGLPAWMPFWAGVGPLGPWPFSPPFPVKITQCIGAPIEDTADGNLAIDDTEGLKRLHRRVIGEVEGLLARAATHGQG